MNGSAVAGNVPGAHSSPKPKRPKRPKPPKLNREELPDVMRPIDVERYLGLSRNTISAALRAGNIPGARLISRSWIISKAAFLKGLEDGKP